MKDETSGVIAVVIFVVCSVVGMIGGCGSESSTYTPSRTSSSSDFETRYAENRFRQEGYSSKDSATAARAVKKFLDAQRNR